MGSPVIFSGRRAKVLTADGLLLSSNSKVDFDGSVNYITNGHAAVNTTGWATYADAAGASPVDGTGGSPNVTFTRTTTTPLRGQASFLLTKDAANRQGQGASYDFTIDEADKGKTLFINCNYSVASGTYASSDLAVFIYDVTNASVITPANNGIDTTSTSAIESLSFSASATSTSYRLIIHVASTSASAYTVKLDAVSVGPVAIAYSSSTPNSSMTLDNLALSASVGSSALTIAVKTRSLTDATATNPIYIGFRNATAATGDFNVRTVTAALSLTISSGSTLGHKNGLAQYIYVYAVDSGSGVVLAATSVPLDEGSVRTTTAEGGAGAADLVYGVYSTAAQTSKPVRLIGRLLSTQTTAGTWAAVPTEISLPPFDIPAIAMDYQGATNSFANSTDTAVQHTTKKTDPYNLYNTSNGECTIPRTGRYLVAHAFGANYTSINSATNGTQISISLNGGGESLVVNQNFMSTSAGNRCVSKTGVLELTEGDLIRSIVNQSSGSTVSTGLTQQPEFAVTYLGK